jgi:serine/threonine protein kinase
MANSPAWTDEDRRLVRDPDFPECSYTRGCHLGQGGYARVYKVLDRRTGGVYAGKTSPDAVKHLRKEARILRSLDHVSCCNFTLLYYAERLTVHISYDPAQHCQVYRIL